MVGQDSRRVQTAVLGDKRSETPISLPPEAIDVKRFRRKYRRRTFWCGLRLGGCGAQLTTKLYGDRACHFAHFPHPEGHLRACSRTAIGVASADHLYIKASLSKWLAGQGIRATITFPTPGRAPIGSVVDVRIASGGLLRVHLTDHVRPRWQDDPPEEALLGPAVAVDEDIVEELGHLHRIRCESRGTSREVALGTQILGRAVEWFPLDECRMTPEGLTTPGTDRLRRGRRTPRQPLPAPAGGPGQPADDASMLTGGPLPTAVIDLMRCLYAAQRTGNTRLATQICDEAQQVCDALDGRARVELRGAIGDIRAWLDERKQYRQQVFIKLGTAVEGGNRPGVHAALSRAESLVRQGASANERELIKRGRALLRQPARTTHADKTGVDDPTGKVEAAKSERERLELVAGVRNLLNELRRTGTTLSPSDFARKVRQLNSLAAQAGPALKPKLRAEVTRWSKAQEKQAGKTRPRHHGSS